MDTIIRKMKTYTLFDDWLLMILRYETGRIVLESVITVQCVRMDWNYNFHTERYKTFFRVFIWRTCQQTSLFRWFIIYSSGPLPYVKKKKNQYRTSYLKIVISGTRPLDLFGQYTWRIENFSKEKKREMKSEPFEAGGYKW